MAPFPRRTQGEPKAGLHGYHGKGFHSGQGHLVYSNNGQRGSADMKNPFTKSGVLAQRDGKSMSLETFLEK